MLRYGPLGFHQDHAAFVWLFLALVVALLVVSIVALVSLWHTQKRRAMPYPMRMMPQTGFDPALVELRVRYARGDITWEEYAMRSAHLGFPLPPGPGSPPGTPTPPPAP